MMRSGGTRRLIRALHRQRLRHRLYSCHWLVRKKPSSPAATGFGTRQSPEWPGLDTLLQPAREHAALLRAGSFNRTKLTQQVTSPRFEGLLLLGGFACYTSSSSLCTTRPRSRLPRIAPASSAFSEVWWKLIGQNSCVGKNLVPIAQRSSGAGHLVSARATPNDRTAGGGNSCEFTPARSSHPAHFAVRRTWECSTVSSIAR